LHFCYPRLDQVQGIYNGFYLKSIGKKYTLLADTKQESDRWMLKLKYNCLVVLRHATSVYTFGQLIGRGNYAKVHMATHKITGQKYAIKSIFKNKLISNEKTMVFF